MAIHHDKRAYGKLASMREELKEEQILKMLEELGGEEEKNEEQPADAKNEGEKQSKH